MKRLHGRVALVTGASSGIGRALCESFAHEGCTVVLADIEAGPLAEAEAALQRLGGRTLSVATDVADAASVDELARRVLDELGALHVLCNNAGVSMRSKLVDTTLDDWKWVLGVNLWGVIHGLRCFLPTLLQQDEAHIVNVASVTPLVPGPFAAVYAASKAAVIAISEVLYKELALTGPHVGISVACPAGVRTNIGTSARNRPAELPPGASLDPKRLFEEFPSIGRRVQALVDSGITPAQMAEMVLDAIKTRRFWVLPADQEIRDAITTRAQDMVLGNPPRPGPQG